MIANFIRSNFHDFGVPNHFPQGSYNDFDECAMVYTIASATRLLDNKDRVAR